VAGDDAVAHARREPLDLAEDALGHIDVRAVGHVTVGPHDVHAGRRAGRVEEARLGEQHERALGDPTCVDGRLGLRDLLERAPQVDSPGP
jgi:hypothetical protein